MLQGKAWPVEEAAACLGGWRLSTLFSFCHLQCRGMVPLNQVVLQSFIGELMMAAVVQVFRRFFSPSSKMRVNKVNRVSIIFAQL